MKLYLFLDLITLFFPLVLSWDKRVQFYKQFKALFMAIAAVGFVFVVWDIYFTKWGVWGFNEAHLIGVEWLGLPIEEISFFIVVPYACVFLHDTFNRYWPVKSTWPYAKLITVAWGLISVVLFAMNTDQYYTASACGLSALTALIVLTQSPTRTLSLWRSFLVIAVPFLIVNGALTGSFTEEPVVWYSDAENLGVRIFTIPIEDQFYNFSLLIGIILLRDFIKNRH